MLIIKIIKILFKRLFCFHLQWKYIGPGIYGQEFKCPNCGKVKSISFSDYLLGRNIPISYIERMEDYDNRWSRISRKMSRKMSW